MINQNFAILGALISAIGGIGYFLDTLKGKAKPNRVTFLLWSLACFITFIAQVKQGVGIQAILTFSGLFDTVIILLASFLNKKAYWKITSLDIGCGALSLIGLILWQTTKDGNSAISFSIAADFLAAVPTLIKSYRYPKTEHGGAYLACAVGAALTILTINSWTFGTYSWPFYSFAINLLIFILIKIGIDGKKK